MARAGSSRAGGACVALALAAALVVVAIAAAACSSAPQPRVPQGTNPIIGFDSALGSLDSATRIKALDMLEGAGSRWTRIGCYWPHIDAAGPATSTRDWQEVDDYVRDARNHHQTIIGSIIGYASWASGKSDPWYVPTDTAQFSAFAAICATRYANDISIWEIWNEPNASFFKPRPNAAAYARMLHNTCLAIKRVNPRARIVGGSLYRNNYGYLRRLYAALRSYPGAAANHFFFDYLSVHPYCDDRSPDSTDPAFILPGVDNNFSGLVKMKQLMEQEGDGAKHIMVTEMSWPVANMSWTNGVSVEHQAQYLTTAYAMAKDWPWLDVMLWYGFKNWNNEEAPWSLVETDLSPRPSFDAFSRAAHTP